MDFPATLLQETKKRNFCKRPFQQRRSMWRLTQTLDIYSQWYAFLPVRVTMKLSNKDQDPRADGLGICRIILDIARAHPDSTTPTEVACSRLCSHSSTV